MQTNADRGDEADNMQQTEYIDRAVEMFRGQQSMWPEETAAAARDEAKRTLAGRFVVPPFTVLDARQGYWRDRKRSWLALGIQSELGRTDGTNWTAGSPVLHDPRVYDKKGAVEKRIGHVITFAEFMAVHYDGKTSLPPASVFDPVLCEIAYRWFCPPGGTVLDPFAGGSVRGVVAAILGRQYVGVDLRGEQVEANREQWAAISTGNPGEPDPRWVTHDSRKLPAVHDTPVDFVFTCPPYFDLEVYSDDPADLSNAEDYDAFLATYGEIIKHAAAVLRPDRFAGIVVGTVRDKRTGIIHDLVGDTTRLAQLAGLDLYNEIILTTSIGNLWARAGRQLATTRKLGKHHQQMLVFCKGDPRKAADACGPIELLPGTDTTAAAEEEWV